MALLPQDRQSQVMMLITLGMLALGYAFWNYWAKPTGEEIAATQAEIKSMEDVIAQAKADLASGTVEDLRRKVEEYSALLAVMRRLVPEKNEVPALIDDISTKAKVRGVTIGRIEPQPVEAGPPFDTYRYRLEIIGHYDQLGEFLSDIASLPRIIVPQDVILKAAARGAHGEHAIRGVRRRAARSGSAGRPGQAQPRGGGETRQRQARQRRGPRAGARGLLVRGWRARPVPLAAPVGRHPAAPVGPAAGGHLLRRAVSRAQRRGAARCNQQQSVSSEAGQHHRAPQGYHDPAARNRVYGAGVRLRAAGESAARQAGGNAMKRIAALVPLLLVLTAGASPGRRGVTPRDGEVRAVSVLPAAGSVEVVIDLRGAVDIQDFTLGNPARLVVDLQGARLVAPAVLYDGANRGGIKNLRYAQFRPGVVRVVIDLDALKDYQIERRDGQVRVKIGSERTAFEAWSSESVASAPPAAVVPAVAQRTAGRGGQAARVATTAQSG